MSMGLLGKMFGGRGTKLGLIKEMTKFRIQNDPGAKPLGVSTSAVDRMPEAQIMGLPEATIATIVETYTRLKKQGSQDGDIFDLIEAHRSRFGKVGNLPSPLNLYSYTKYRSRLDHPDFIVGEDVVEELIEKACQFFK